MQMQTLAGLKVLELGTVLAVPAVGQFLAEQGAEVVKVEPPQGDVTRSWILPGETVQEGISAYFSSVNWGKQFVQLDLKKNDSRLVLDKLLNWADVVLMNYKPGDEAKLRLVPEELLKLKPSQIIARLTGYGPEDPRPGFDALVQAEAGFQYLNRMPGQPPQKMPVALMDLMAAHQMKEAILLALLHRERTGAGQCIEVDLFSSGIASLANQAAAVSWAQLEPEPMGSDHPSIAPYGTVFQTQEGREVILAVGTDGQFAALCQVLGRPELAMDARFATNPERVQHREPLKNALAYSIREWNLTDLKSALQEAKVPFAPIATVSEALSSPQAKHLLLGVESRGGVRQSIFCTSPLNLSPPGPIGRDNVRWGIAD